MKTEPNEPISPVTHDAGDVTRGLTKREYFAAMAMQGLITNAAMGQIGNYKEGSMLAIDWTDALIEALNK